MCTWCKQVETVSNVAVLPSYAMIAMLKIKIKLAVAVAMGVNGYKLRGMPTVLQNW